jgi:flagellar biosynthesis protein FlhG
MLVERGSDQAAGLRRMFSASGARVIEIIAGEPGVGRTTIAFHLGAALARLGLHTLLVDVVAARGASRVPSRLQLDAARAHGSRAVASDPEASLFGALEVIGTARAATGRGEPSALDTRTLLRTAASRDCVLVSSLGAERIVVAADGRRDLLVVVSPLASSITTAYALVKRVVYASGACRFRVVVNQAESAAAATRIYENFARVAMGYLGVRLELAGFIPVDPGLAHASAHGLSVIDCNSNGPSARALCPLAEAIGGVRGAAALAREARVDIAGTAVPVAS